jgi:hypothetical protein
LSGSAAVSRITSSIGLPAVPPEPAANKPFHIELEKLALSTYCPDGVGRWFYERAAGSYNTMLARDGTTPARLRQLKDAIPSSRKITKTDLAKYLNAWAEKPVKSVRKDPRLADILIGAPAGQPEFEEWRELLGNDGAGIPFLRYLPESFGPLGTRVEKALRERIGKAPSFVAFEGYDMILVLAELLRAYGTDRVRIAEAWPHIVVEGTRGQIKFSRTSDISVWQWTWAPIQVVDRNPADADCFRILSVA